MVPGRLNEAEMRAFKREDRAQKVWRMRNVLEGDFENKGIGVRSESWFTQDDKVRLDGTENKDKLYLWRKAICMLVKKEGAVSILYEMMKQENKWATDVVEQVWELQPGDPITIGFREWLVRQVGYTEKRTGKGVMVKGNFRGNQNNIESHIKKSIECWKRQQDEMDEEDRQISPIETERQVIDLSGEAEMEVEQTKRADKVQERVDKVRDDDEMIEKWITEYEGEEWEKEIDKDRHKDIKERIRKIKKEQKEKEK